MDIKYNMNKDRLLELLNVMLNDLITTPVYFQTGLCRIAKLLDSNDRCTENEKYQILDYLHKNKPTIDNQYKEFTTSKFWINSIYWWYSMDVEDGAKQIRIEYLTKLIANTK